MKAGEILGRDAEGFIQVFQLFPFGFRDEAGRTDSEGRFQRGDRGTVYLQEDEDEAYDAPSAIPHEGSERCKGFDVAGPGDADNEVEEPENRSDESHS